MSPKNHSRSKHHRFGSETRAADGLIATFELPDGSIRVEHFCQVVRTRGTRSIRNVTKEGLASIAQVAVRADELGAKVLSLSSPSTILTDLQGSRANHSVRVGERNIRTDTEFPELTMFSRIGRADLFRAPRQRVLAENSTRPARRQTHR